MTPEEAVRQRLLDISAVTAIVGTRIYVDHLPQNEITEETPSAVLVQLVHEPTEYHLRGGLRRVARVQVDAYVHDSGSDPMGDVIELANAIHGDDAGSGLSGWTGNTGGSPSLDITGILRIDRQRGYEPDELRLLRQRQDYWVHYRLT